MSEKWLNHNEWITEQFQEKYLKKSYRNSIIHSLIIEGVLEGGSGVKGFDTASKFLLCSGKISSSEFCVFNEIRKIRNDIVHGIFKKKGISQKDMDKLLSNITSKIHEVYETSNFFDKDLFKKYSIVRKDEIKFKPIIKK